MSEAWETAFRLLAMMRPVEAGRMIGERLKKLSPDQYDEAQQWFAVVDCITALILCTTRH